MASIFVVDIYYMKAQFVYENLDFERAQDPKKSMGIGQAALYGKEIEKAFVDFLQYVAGMNNYSALFYSKDGKTIRFSGNTDGGWKSTLNYLMSKHNLTKYLEMPGKSTGTPRNPSAVYKIKNEFQPYFVGFDASPLFYKLHENLDFERSVDPKKSMGIGRLARGPELFTEFFEEINKTNPYGLIISHIRKRTYFKGIEEMKNHLDIDIYGKKIKENFNKLLKEYKLDQFIKLPGIQGFGNPFHRVRHYPIRPEFWEDFENLDLDANL